MMRINILLLLIFSLHNTGNAQQKKFGDISEEELKMTMYDADSSANAVVLFDVGEVYIDEKLEVNFTRHKRVKILTDDGLSVGDVSILYRDVSPRQKVTKLKAVSYHLNDKGKIKTSKLGRRDSFRENVSDNWKKLKFTMPGLRKGAVFEFSYNVKSASPVDVPDWYFQRDIPVAWSEYKVKIPEWFNYMPFQRSYHKFTIQDQKKYQASANINYTTTNSRNRFLPDSKSHRTQRVEYTGTDYHFAMKDIPALTDEPFMKAKNDYMAQVQFQLVSYQFPGDRLRTVLDSWPSLIDVFSDYDDYGKRLRSNSLLKQKTQEVTAGSSSDFEKMIRIYEHINSIMKWDKSHRLYVNKNLDKLYEEGSGNSSEINFVLIQMLREAGLEVDPVILSTRNNGEIIAIYPLADQFNHTLARVKIDGKSYLLDAKDENRPYNILPANNLNGKGLVVKKGGSPVWVDLVNEADNKLIHVVNLEVDPEGNILGNIESKNDGLMAQLSREQLDEDIKENLLSKVFTETDNLFIDTVKVTSGDSDEHYTYKAEFRYANDLDGDVRYLNPMMVERVLENPFKKAERSFPIDYNYTFNKSIVMNIVLPDEWTLDELPESKIFHLPDKNGIYSRIIQSMGDNLISMRYNFTIVETRFMPEWYEGLRLFYDTLLNDHAEMIVLTKEQKE